MIRRPRSYGAHSPAPLPQWAQTPGSGLPVPMAMAGGMATLFLLTYLPDYGLSHPLHVPVPPPSIFVFLLGATALMAYLLSGRIPFDRTAAWVFTWGFALLTLTLVGFAMVGFSLASLEPFKNRIYAIVSLFATFTLCRDRWGRWALVRVFLLALIVDLLFQGYEMSHPSTFSEVNGRAAGLFQNPNAAAAAIGGTLLALWDELPSWSKGPLFALATVGILGTFSRACMSGWLMVGILGLPVGLWKGRQGSLWMFLLLAALAAFLLFIQSGMLEILHWEALNGNTLNRIRFGVGDGSAMDRAEIARMGWAKVTESPWFGYGLAAPFRFNVLATHNMYLFNWIEHGVLGVLLLPTILLPLAWGRPNARLFLFFSLWMGLFSHNLLDARYFLLPLGFLLALLPGARVAGDPSAAP